MIKEINGIIKFKREDNSDCVCCKGNHIFCKYISKVNSDKPIDINSEVDKLLTEDTENKRIKISIEVE
jgi:hypothetical protein